MAEQKPKGLRSLRDYLSKYPRLMWQLALGMLVGTTLKLAMPFLTQSIVDVGIMNNNLNFIYVFLAAQLMLRFRGDEKLFKQGVTSKFEFIASKNTRLEKQRERESFQKEILSNNLKLNEIERDVQEISYAHTEKKRVCLDNIGRSLHNIENNLRYWQQNYLITAPADGKLVFLKKLSENQYLKATDTLFALMPVEETFIATVDILVHGMGKARIGQKVILKLDDYPYEEFGMLEENVINMEPSLTIHFYRVTVSLSNGLLSTYNQKFKFRSEMAGTAQIVTADLRLIEHAFYGLRKLLM